MKKLTDLSGSDRSKDSCARVPDLPHMILARFIDYYTFDDDDYDDFDDKDDKFCKNANNVPDIPHMILARLRRMANQSLQHVESTKVVQPNI